MQGKVVFIETPACVQDKMQLTNMSCFNFKWHIQLTLKERGLENLSSIQQLVVCSNAGKGIMITLTNLPANHRKKKVSITDKQAFGYQFRLLCYVRLNTFPKTKF